MPDTVDSLHQAFTAYRQHHRKGAYPVVLRRRAVAALSPSERLQLAARLGLTVQQVERWSALSSAAEPPGALLPVAAQQFFEVSGGGPAPAVGAGLRIEVHLRNGAVLRMQGQVDSAAVRMLVAALQTEQVTA